jgi:hypothetical protein
MADRIQSSAAAKMLGVSKALVIQMAAKGELPGACKIASLWTFDPEKLQKWVEEKETQCQSQTQTKISFAATAHGICEPTSKAKSSIEACEQMMSKLLAENETKRSKKQPIGRGAEIVSLHGSTR